VIGIAFDGVDHGDRASELQAAAVSEHNLAEHLDFDNIERWFDFAH